MTDHAEPTSDAVRRDQLLASMNLTLCHVQELVGLAYQLSCELHPTDTADAILRSSGRLATLMHLSTEQLASAQAYTQSLTEILAPPTAVLPAGARGRH
ncbi:MAG: hypothetical protein ACOZE7_18900 [Pseudomonadota bacterium]|jgi:hypothetical protein